MNCAASFLFLPGLPQSILSTSDLARRVEPQNSNGLGDALEVISESFRMAVILDIDGCTARSLLHDVEDALEDKLAIADALDLTVESDSVFVRTEHSCSADVAVIWKKIVHGILGHTWISPGSEHKKVCLDASVHEFYE